MSDFFTRHYDEVYSSCNEVQYVKNCIRDTALPGKFKGVLESYGIIYSTNATYSKCDTWESEVPVELPKGWVMQKNNAKKSTLCIG